ncbi:MAG: hypothetical protein Q7T78_13560 [Rhodoferax sp.]|nr:hypothetical protein [Rhodoferax sp.]
MKNYRLGDFRATFHSPDTQSFKRIFRAKLPDLPGVIYAVSEFQVKTDKSHSLIVSRRRVSALSCLSPPWKAAVQSGFRTTTTLFLAWVPAYSRWFMRTPADFVRRTDRDQLALVGDTL